jgi:hypothetical protein
MNTKDKSAASCKEYRALENLLSTSTAKSAVLVSIVSYRCNMPQVLLSHFSVDDIKTERGIAA